MGREKVYYMLRLARPCYLDLLTHFYPTALNKTVLRVFRMSILLFDLRFVPDDEAQDIRDLLNENEIDFYETSAGIMGLSMPGIWLKDETPLVKARALIDDYQIQRQQRARKEYQDRLDSGQSRSIIDIFKEAPLRFIGYLLTIAIVIYISVVFFFSLV